MRAHRKAWQRGHDAKRLPWQRRAAEHARPIVLEAPEQFSLTKEPHRSALLRFLADLKRLTLIAGKNVQIDWRRTRKMYPEGTLVFAAELDVILSSAGRPAPVRCNRPTDSVVDQLLQHLGLAAKMRRKGEADITADNVKYWQVKTDTRVDASHTEQLIKDYEGYFSGEASAKLYEGLTEAMTNAKHHAYAPANGGTGTAPRWWMFSQMKDGILSVSFCDLGMGFRKSLMSGEHWAKQLVLNAVDRLGAGRSDAHFIRVAFVLGKTRTKAPHRGKGLEELKRAIESVGGRLRILSHKGNYFYSASDRKEEAFDFDDSLPGTVISWQVALPKGNKP